MKNSRLWTSFAATAAMFALLAGCNVNGQRGFGDQGDHQVNVLTSTEDAKPLSQLVREALRNNGQTAISRIRVSQDSRDTVKLTGNVSDSAIKYEAERVAASVDGVRFVVNNLNIQR